MRIEPLTRDIYIRFSGEPPSMTVKGFAVLDGDDVYGILGLINTDGQHFVICATKDGINKRAAVNAWRLFKNKYMHENQRYYAILDDKISTAKGLCAHVGFVHLVDDIYIYRG